MQGIARGCEGLLHFRPRGVSFHTGAGHGVVNLAPKFNIPVKPARGSLTFVVVIAETTPSLVCDGALLTPADEQVHLLFSWEEESERVGGPSTMMVPSSHNWRSSA